MSLKDSRIGFIGGGAMAEALAGGLVASGVAPANIRVSDIAPERRSHLEAALGVATTASNDEVARGSDLVVLALKPAMIAPALAGLAELQPAELLAPLWLSIAAGTPIATIEAALPTGARVVRAMPNTPALVRAGATAICGNAAATREDIALAAALFDSVGIHWEAPSEDLLDPVTGLSGSGPAYLFRFIEALTTAGERVGLPSDVAGRLAAQTVYGAAKLAHESEDSPTRLREKVSSPGGTTLAGLARLEADGFEEAVAAAVRAATDRSKELAG